MKKVLFILSVCVLAPGVTGCRTQEKAALTGTYWKLTGLSGQPLPEPEDSTVKPYLTFHVEENAVSGNGGCNPFRGTYELKPNSGIHFRPIAITRKMCLFANPEDRFMRVFEQVERYGLKGSTLTLFGKDDTPLAQFTAVKK
jgi:heat shock protein HslJ